MIHLEISHELEKLGHFFKSTQRQILIKSIKRALRRTANPLQRESVDRVRKFRALKAKLIKQRWFKLRKKLNGMDMQKIQLELEIMKKPLNLIDVVVGQKTPRSQAGIPVKRRRPLKVRIVPGKTEKVQGGFIARGKKSGQFHVFRRKGPGKSTLVKQAAPSLHVLFEKEFFRKPIEREISKRLGKEFGAAYDYFLAQSLK